VRILLDHNLDWRLGDHLSGHEVRTALEMAWDMLKNGALLKEAEGAGFSVLITSDKGIKDQQSMKGAQSESSSYEHRIPQHDVSIECQSRF
jgi:hypothetical protein